MTRVASTVQTEPMVINGEFYKFYPKTLSQSNNIQSFYSTFSVRLVPGRIRVSSYTT